MDIRSATNSMICNFARDPINILQMFYNFYQKFPYGNFG